MLCPTYHIDLETPAASTCESRLVYTLGDTRHLLWQITKNIHLSRQTCTTHHLKPLQVHEHQSYHQDPTHTSECRMHLNKYLSASYVNTKQNLSGYVHLSSGLPIYMTTPRPPLKFRLRSSGLLVSAVLLGFSTIFVQIVHMSYEKPHFRPNGPPEGDFQ